MPLESSSSQGHHYGEPVNEAMQASATQGRPGSQMTQSGNSSTSTGVHDMRRKGVGDGAGEDRHMESGATPSLNSWAPGAAGPMAVDRYARDDDVAVPSALLVFQDALPFGNWGD